MQILTSTSKNLILALLSCTLAMIWLNNNSSLNVTDTFTTNARVATVYPSVYHSVYSTADHPVESIWKSMASEFTLDNKAQTYQVQNEIRKLLADQGKLYSILLAAGPYIYFIHKQTQAHGLPAELALIPVIESEFNPNDHSTKGATGLWQLMPETAHGLGIKVTKPSYDGRRNVIASTHAALSYFKDLGTLFNGNWYLAIAAYNCGEGRVASAQRRTGSDNFFKLPLPLETKYYVPKLLAVAAIIKNPEKYGVTLPPIKNTPYFTELKIKNSVSLASVAKSSGASIESLHTLNPDYNHGTVPNKTGDTILIPANKSVVAKEKITI